MHEQKKARETPARTLIAGIESNQGIVDCNVAALSNSKLARIPIKTSRPGE